MKRLTLLYSNSLNPLILERLGALKRSENFECSVLNLHRTNSGIDMPLSIDLNLNQSSITFNEGLLFSRLKALFKLFLKVQKNPPDVIYCLYLDMLFISFFTKILHPKMQIIYEVQDVNQTNLIWRLIENFLCLFVYRILLTSKGFAKIFFFTNKKKCIYISNCPDHKLWKEELGHFKISSDSSNVIGVIGLIRHKSQLQDIENILLNTKLKVFQAGGCIFPNELSEIKKKFKNRIHIHGKYTQLSLYKDILPRVSAVWACYPNKMNYRLHIARRYNESRMLNIPVIISAHANEMISVANGCSDVFIFSQNYASLEKFINKKYLAYSINYDFSFQLYSNLIEETMNNLYKKLTS